MKRGLKLSFAISLALLAVAGCHRNDEQNSRADTAQPGTPATSSTPAVDRNADTSSAATTSGDASAAASAAAADQAGAAPGAAAAGALTQGQAVAMVGAVDKHEIAAAEQAKRKKVTGEVADYASLLHREHSKNLEAGQKLGVAESSSETTAMEEKGRSELATLDQKSGKEYEKAYIDAMVKGHEEALSMLDTRLIPAARDENVRTFLTGSREHVAMHLERAKALQTKAGGAAP